MYTTGDHLYFAGAFHIPSLFHHGVYVGNNQVAHFWGQASKKMEASIRLVPIETFEALAAAEHQTVHVLPVKSRLSPEETKQRALSRVGMRGYHAVTNNCEHFVNWCVQGVAYSPQVNFQFKITPTDPRATLRLVRDSRTPTGLAYVEV